MLKGRIIFALLVFVCVGCSPATAPTDVPATVSGGVTVVKVPTRNPTSPTAATIAPTAVSVRPTATKVSTDKPTVLPTKSISCSSTLTGGVYPNIPTLNIADLYRCRPEARTTISVIQRNGPFQYDQDDTIFSNREGILPPLAKNAYHEYTVITPGASTRGTRRILAAGDPNRKPNEFSKLYYTDDHYATAWLVTGIGQ